MVASVLKSRLHAVCTAHMFHRDITRHWGIDQRSLCETRHDSIRHCTVEDLHGDRLVSAFPDSYRSNRDDPSISKSRSCILLLHHGWNMERLFPVVLIVQYVGW
jgi:hypothetical protein